MLAIIIVLGAGATSGEPSFQHGISFFGELKYPPHFEHFDYVNPNAPKGGMLVLAEDRNWNSFTPHLYKGIAVPGQNVINYPVLYDGLFSAADDELGAYYGNLAAAVMIADDFTWVRIRLRSEAHWHDGVPITARDVKFTFDHIRNFSSFNLKAGFGMVESVEVHGERELTFYLRDINGLNANVVSSLGKIAILPEHYWRERDITETTLTPPLGSGPYRVSHAEQGRFLLYERVPEYWGRNLPVHRGRHNFDYLRYDYYRDGTVEREAFRKGLIDYREETDPRYWYNGYNIPARDKGWIVMRRHNHGNYIGLARGLAINTRRENLKDVRVREALTLAFDYDWYKNNITQGFYQRPESYFAQSRFSAVGMPDASELRLLVPFMDQLPKRLFTEPFKLARFPGTGRNRDALLRARELLKECGWHVIEGALKNASGKPFTLSFVVRSIDERRLLMQYVDQLHRLGFETRIRMVETSQYLNILKDFDFDIAVGRYATAQPAGIEIISYWHSSNALLPHVRNLSGIQDDAVDEMLMRVLNARSEEELTPAQKALDRILLWNFYMIPLISVEGPRVIYWNKFGRPPLDAEFRTSFPDTWWYDKKKAEQITLSN